MEVQFLMSDQSRAEHFKAFIQSLIGKFQPQKIIKFGKQTLSNEIEGCFANKQIIHSHYCLLMVTENITRIDYEVQDYANSHYHHGQITILCHGQDAIKEAIKANSRFFITVSNTGQLLYSNDGFTQFDAETHFIPVGALEKAEKHFFHRIPLADGFLQGACECLLKHHFNICTFMLHQVVEQCCIVLIRIHIAYRSEFHNLHRLLSLCRCFSEEPYKMLLSGSPTDRRLFDILVKSYSQARYADTFIVEQADAEQLYKKASAFLQLVKCMCKEKMEELSEIGLQYEQQNKESEVGHE